MKCTCINLSKSYGKRIAVDHIDLELSNGIYALLGPNGAGKSTLMNMLLGLIPLDSGTILLEEGKYPYKSNSYYHQIGYLPQFPKFYPNFTAYEFLDYMCALKKIDKSSRRDKINEILTMVHLENESKTKISAFSGGMKQRLGIAQALLNHPKFLLFDEPTAGLDPKERIRFRNIFSKLSEDCIVLFATHIVSDIELIANEIILMNHGHIIKQSKREELIKELDGKVWEICADNESKHMSLQISQVTYSDNQIKYRTISDSKPTQSAKQVEATLEDVYLYYFGEDNND